MFYTVIKFDGHLKTREKCENNEPKACDLNISLLFSNVQRVFSQYKTWLNLLYLLYDIDLYHEKEVENNKTRSSDKTGFFSQSERALDCIYVHIKSVGGCGQ
jgi:hypothetical protein